MNVGQTQTGQMSFGLELLLGRIAPREDLQSAEAVRVISHCIEKAGMTAACLS
jgi:hypothetical protein